MNMTASSSGWGERPPSTVMVPSQLITVVTPSSSKGLPVSPKPFTGVLALAPAPTDDRFQENNLCGARIALAIIPTLPRKLRRFHFELSRIKPAP